MADQDPNTAPQPQINTALPPPDRTTVIDPYGNWGTMDVAEAKDATQNGGFRIPSTSELQEKATSQQYGTGLGSAVAAGSLGALNAATFGIGNKILSKTGIVSPEEQANYAKYRPIATGLGEGVGIIGSLLAGPESVAVKGAAEALRTAQATGDAAKIAEAAQALKTIKGSSAALTAGDALNPVSGISKIGDISQAAAKPYIEKAVGLFVNPETRPLLSKIVNDTATAGLGAATEGAAYGLGQSINESALGDPDLNAQKVMSNIGYSALLGGGLGSLLKAGEIVAPEALSVAQDAATNLYNKASGLGGKAFSEASSWVSGKSSSDIFDAWMNRAKANIDPEKFLGMSQDFADGLNDQHGSIQRLLRATNNDIRPEESDLLLQGTDVDVAKQQWEKTLGNIDTTISSMRAEPDLYPAYAARKLEMIRDGAQKSISEQSPSAYFESLNDMKGRLDNEIKYGKMPGPQEQAAQSAIRDVRTDIKNNLENESIWGEAAARQSAFNDAQSNFFNLTGNGGLFRKYFMQKTLTRGGNVAYEVDPGKIRSFFSQMDTLKGEEKGKILKSFMDSSQNVTDQVAKTYESLPARNFDKDAITNLLVKNQKMTQDTLGQASFQKKMGTLGGGAHNVPLGEAGTLLVGMHNPALAAGMEAWHMAKAPALVIQRLAKIEKAVRSTTNFTVKAANAIFKVGSKVGEPVAGYVGSKINQSLNLDDFSKISNNISRMNNDPEQMINHLSDKTQSLYAVAPQMSGSIQTAAVRANQFLVSKLPQNPPPLPLSPPMEPSGADIAKFSIYLNTVEHPHQVLSEIKDATLAPESMEALQAVYPHLLQDMRATVAEALTTHISKKGSTIPYKTRLALGMFMGQDMDYSTQQQNIAFNQMTLAGGSQSQSQDQVQGGQAVKTSQKGLSALNRAQQSLTPMQASAQRERA
jgi:hypothetical protein